MQRAVQHTPFGRVIEPVGKLTRDAKRVRKRNAAVFTQHDVERVGRGEVLREKRVVADVDAGGSRRGYDRVLQFRRDQLFEFADELVHALGR